MSDVKNSTTNEDAITPLPVEQQFLQDVINKEYGSLEEILEYKCKIIGEGKGFLSFVTKVDITWSHHGSVEPPSRIVIKNPTDEKLRHIELVEEVFKDNLLEKLHNSEVDSYAYFNLHKPPPCPIARVIYTRKFTENQKGLLILEFVEGRSLTLNEDNTYEQMQSIVKNIASVQAYGINHGQLAEYLVPLTSSFIEPSLDMFRESVEKVNDMFPDIMPLSDQRIDNVLNQVRALCETLKNPDTLGDRQVAVLGDVQPNNVFWKTNPDGSLTDQISAVMDFQITHRGGCMFDICCAMFWGLTSDQRHQYQDDLLQLYQDTLEAKTGGRTVMPLVELQQEYRRYLVVFAVMYMGFVAEMPGLKDTMKFTDERIRQLANKAASVFEDKYDLID